MFEGDFEALLMNPPRAAVRPRADFRGGPYPEPTADFIQKPSYVVSDKTAGPLGRGLLVATTPCVAAPLKVSET